MISSGRLSSRRVTNSGVTENAACRPFGEFDFGDDFGLEPNVVFHVLGGYAFAPVTQLGCGQICEWTDFNTQRLERLEQGPSIGRV